MMPVCPDEIVVHPLHVSDGLGDVDGVLLQYPTLDDDAPAQMSLPIAETCAADMDFAIW